MRDPLKQRARSAVKRAITAGVLVRPDQCSRCKKPAGTGSDGRSLMHGHHHDYTKPLEVEWLCFHCHVEETNEQGQYAIGERNGRTKYPEALIVRMRELRATGLPYAKIAEICGCDISYAWKAVTGINRKRAA